MALTHWADHHLPAAVALALTFAALSAVSLLGAAGWAVLAALEVGAASSLATVLPLFAVGTVLGLPLTAAAVAVAVIGVTARVSSVAAAKRRAASTRLGRIASRVERESVLARWLGIAALVEDVDGRSPERRADDRIDGLKRRYVNGGLSEWELEERTRIVLDEEGVPRERPSRIDDELRAAERD